jgi:hypothetical protein
MRARSLVDVGIVTTTSFFPDERGVTRPAVLVVLDLE